MTQFVNMFRVDLLDSNSQIANINICYQGNANANRVGARVYRGGEPVALTGTCAAAVTRADGTFVPLTGTISGNEAYVTLDSNCYEVTGPLRVVITVTDGSVETTLLAVFGTVAETASGEIIQPAERLPDYVQLLAEIDNMRDATSAANTAATNANGALSYIAPTEASSTASAAHAKGTYFIYNGTLYRATADIAVGDTIVTSGSGKNCESVTVGNEFANLVKAVNAIDGLEIIQFAEGGYIVTNGSTVSVGTVVANPAGYSYKHAVVPVTPGDVITITGKGGNSARLWSFWDDNGDAVTDGMANSNAQLTLGAITAPAGAAVLVLNSFSESTFAVNGRTMAARLAETNDRITALDGKTAAKSTEIERHFDVNANAGIDPDAPLEWVNNSTTIWRATNESPDLAPYINTPVTQSTRCSCKPFLVPPGGAYIYYDESIRANNKTEYRVNFLRLVDGAFVMLDPTLGAETDYDYMMTQNDRTIPIYIHYDENLYISITYYMAVFDGTLHVSCGQIDNEGFSNVPFLFPVYTKVYVEGGDNDSEDASGGTLVVDIGSYSPNYFYSYTRAYGCILPLKNTRRIIAAPRYNLIAQIYTINANAEEITQPETLYSATIPDNKEFVEGLPIIDLGDYAGSDGYVIVCVLRSYYFQGNTRKNDSMGVLTMYDDCVSNVVVEWDTNTVVSHDGAIPARAKMNIETMKRHHADTVTFRYGSWIKPGVTYPIPAMKDANFLFYSGTNHGDVPFRDVTLRSLYSAAKNPASRLFRYGSIRNPGGTGLGYGATCGQMAGLIAGFNGAITPAGIYYDMYRHAGITVRDIQTIEDLRTGDFIARLNPDSFEYGHVVYITDVVRLNNVVFAAIGLEAYPPFMRYRAFVNYDAFPFNETGDNPTKLFSFYSSREIGTMYGTGSKYTRAGRLDATKYKTFRQSYGYMDESHTPVDSGVMCDRGSGSVYCIGQYCEIGISAAIRDEMVNNDTVIQVYRGVELAGSITKNDLPAEPNPTYDHGRYIVDIRAMLTDSGVYEIRYNNILKDRFLVAQPQTVQCTAEEPTPEPTEEPTAEPTEEVTEETTEEDGVSTQYVRVSFSQNGAAAVNVAVYYKITDPNVNHDQITTFELTEADQANGYIIIPRIITQDYWFDYVDVLYRTASNGTFHVLQYSPTKPLVDENGDVPDESEIVTQQGSSYLGIL